ncbi:MAG: tRNA (adenosine(37)-N6)-threonylcarbamoyltransferase complex ATPase subunit type 1 TsaE [Planctomycetota bacterium]
MRGAFETSAVSSSAAETVRLAARLGSLLRPGDVIALVGELGSGKTTFTKGLALGLGAEDASAVSSPTYVLEQVYPTRIPLHHYDAYRLGSEREFLALGFEERCLGANVLVVEWADRVAGALPEEALWVELRLAEGSQSSREIRFSGMAPYWEPRLEALLRGGAPPEAEG